jgi:hypothetical protein
MASEDERRAGNHRELPSENERLVCEDRDPAGADRDPVDAVRMTHLERRAHLLLRVYPAAYRRERGEEIIGTLLETSADRTWPRLRDVCALAVGGLKARAAQNRQRPVGANLRVAVMAGLAFYTAFWFATYMDGVVQGFVWLEPSTPIGWTSWPAAVTALLAGATVVLAWTAPRIGVVTGVLAVGAVVAFAVANHDALLAHVVQVVSLAGLAALAPRAGRPSRHWLWLPGVMAVSPLIELGMSYGWLGYSWPLHMLELSLLAFAVVGILWIGIDARLMLAVLTFFALTAVQMAVVEIPSGAAILAMLPFPLVIATLAAASGWLLRRQSARAMRTS